MNDFIRLEINGHEISKTDNAKFLGLHFDSTMKWDYHISRKCNQISKTLAVMTKLKNYLPNWTLLTLYNSLILPHMTYGIVAWGNANASLLKRMTILQKRAIRTISGSKYNSHTNPLFKNLKLLTLEDLFQLECCKIYAKYCLGNLPQYISHQLDANVNSHPYPTRSNLDALPPLIRTKKEEQLIAYKVAKAWNSLPLNIKKFKDNPSTLHTFNRTVKFYKLECYQTECTLNNCFICNNI